MQVDLDGYTQRQLFSGQAPAINFGLVAAVTLAVGVLIWLFIRWKTYVIQRREIRKRKQVELELKALRAQMNPHFLFNSLSSIQNLINKQDPDQAATWVVRHYEPDEEDGEDEELEIMWRFLPLHSACARQPPASVVTALLCAYPDGAKCQDDQGMYALHYACGNQASRD